MLFYLAVICLGLAGISSAQSFSFDGTGRLKVNTTGSSNQLVSVTNTITTTLADTTKLGVTNVSGTYLWVATTNSQTVAQVGTNAGGTYLWTALTNSPAVTQSGTWTVQPGNTPNTVGWLVNVTNSVATTGGANNSTNVGVVGSVAVTNITGGYLWVATTNSQTVAQVGTNAGGTYIWTAQTNAIPAGSAVIGAVTQSGTWNDGVTNSPGTYLWAATTNSQTVAQVGTNAGGTYLWAAITNSPAVTFANTAVTGVTNAGGTYLWVATTNSQTVAQIGTNAGGTYIWTAQTNAIPAGANVIGAVTQSGTWNVGTLTTFPDNEPFNLNQIAGTTVSVGAGASDAGTIRTMPANNAVVAFTNYNNGYAWFGLTNAIPAGANAIGKLAANSGVDIGDVDVTSIAAGDNNIGNMDVASIAAGDTDIGNVDLEIAGSPVSVGAGASDATTLRVMPANNATVGVSNFNNGYLWVGLTNTIVQIDGATNMLAALTNYMAPSTVKIAWKPAAGMASNLASAVPFTLTWLSVINTNTALCQLTAYDSATIPIQGVDSSYSWAVPCNTNGSGFVIPIPVGGQRFSAGLAFWATGGGNTNTTTSGQIFVNGGGKP